MVHAGQDAKAGLDRVAGSPWVDRLARVGLPARGATYLVIGVLALQAAVTFDANRRGGWTRR